MPETTDITKDQLEVKVGEEVFYFRVPSPRDRARLGALAAAYRRQDGLGFADEWGLDADTANLYRSFALLETLLVRADSKDNWVFTENEDKNGKPYVDHTKFPARAQLTLPAIYEGFDKELATFFEKAA